MTDTNRKRIKDDLSHIESAAQDIACLEFCRDDYLTESKAQKIAKLARRIAETIDAEGAQ